MRLFGNDERAMIDALRADLEASTLAQAETARQLVLVVQQLNRITLAAQDLHNRLSLYESGVPVMARLKRAALSKLLSKSARREAPNIVRPIREPNGVDSNPPSDEPNGDGEMGVVS